MELWIHSDASYLSGAHAQSRAGAYYALGECEHPATPNGAIHVLSNIMRQVLASATKAEVGILFYSAQDSSMLRTTLNKMGHRQPATPIQTDNAVANSIVNDRLKERRSKAIDMRFYWIHNCV
jgi:hypothetical protein